MYVCICVIVYSVSLHLSNSYILIPHSLFLSTLPFILLCLLSATHCNSFPILTFSLSFSPTHFFLPPFLSPSLFSLIVTFSSSLSFFFYFFPHSDVVFFDESIDAKLNRYMFKFRNIDTPFLLDNANLHAKTYVPPTANTVGLTDYGKDGRIYEYARFPSLE